MQNPQPQPTITYVYTTPPSTSTKPNYAATTSRALGITQILLGVLLIVLQALSIAYQAGLMFVGHGIWTAIFAIIAGAFGIGASGNKSTCLIITFMVMSILAAVFMTVPLSLSAAAIPMDENGGFFYYDSDDKDTRVALDSLMLVASIVEAVAAIWSSVICCKVLCCANQTSATTQGQMVQYVQGPPGAVGGQPMNIVIAGTSGAIPQQGAPQSFMYAGAPGAMPQQGAPQAYMYAGAQAPVQGHPDPMKGQQGGDSPPPAYSTGNPMDQKSAHMNNY